MSPEVLEAIQTGGTLVFALLAIGALITGQVRTKREVDERDRTIAYEREQKEKAYTRAREVQDSFDRMADAVEARNKLDQERVVSARRNG